MTFKPVLTRKAHKCYGCTAELTAGTPAFTYRYLDNLVWKTVYYCSKCKQKLAPTPTPKEAT